MTGISVGARDHGEAVRLHRACFVLARLMSTDPRMLKLYDMWKKETGIGAMLDVLAHLDDDAISRLWLRAEAEGGDSETAAFAKTAAGGHKRVTAKMESLLREIKLGYPWLRDVLMESFPLRAQAAARRMSAGIEMPLVLPTMNFAVTLESDGLPAKQFSFARVTMPRGRVPSEKGLATIERNVEWLYRARVKHPPETIYGIAKHDGVGRSVVQSGIENAKALLNATLTPCRNSGIDCFGMPE